MTSYSIGDRPVPEPDELSQPFFDATLRGSCCCSTARCGRWMWRRGRCIDCPATTRWSRLRLGTLYSFTLVHQLVHPGSRRDAVQTWRSSTSTRCPSAQLDREYERGAAHRHAPLGRLVPASEHIAVRCSSRCRRVAPMGKRRPQSCSGRAHVRNLQSRPCTSRTGATKLDLAEYYLAVGPESSTRCGSAVHADRSRPASAARSPSEAGAGRSPGVAADRARPLPALRVARRRAVRDRARPRDLGGADVDGGVPPVELARADVENRRMADRSRPHAGLPMTTVRRVAHVVHELLDQLGAVGWPKTSGAGAPHLRSHRAGARLHHVRRAALAFAREVERRVPDAVTTLVAQGPRSAALFVDYNQNARDHTMAAAYSCGACPRPRCPHRSAGRDDDVEPKDCTMATVLAVRRTGDLHGGIDQACSPSTSSSSGPVVMSAPAPSTRRARRRRRVARHQARRGAASHRRGDGAMLPREPPSPSTWSTTAPSRSDWAMPVRSGAGEASSAVSASRRSISLGRREPECRRRPAVLPSSNGQVYASRRQHDGRRLTWGSRGRPELMAQRATRPTPTEASCGKTIATANWQRPREPRRRAPP